MTWPNHGLAHRPVVMGRRGAVASAHPLSSLAGLRMLLEGGNAVDAAVATAAALNVVEPYMSGAGGVGYMVIHSARDGATTVLDYIGRAPAAAEPRRFAREGSKDDGILSPLVPGALGGWLAALERHGTLDRATVFGPAIEYAEGGVPLTIKNQLFWTLSRERLRRWPTSSATYLQGGEVPAVGAIWPQPDLARTFRAVVEGGAEVFYRGPVGAEIARFSQENGGLLTPEDLASYEPSWQAPLSSTYRGYQILCPPPPCSGLQYLQTLKIVEGFDMAALGQNSADYVHMLAEAMKLAVADRTTYAPLLDAPVDWLLSEGYIAGRRAQIDPDRAGYSGGERYTSQKLPQEIKAGSVARGQAGSVARGEAGSAAGGQAGSAESIARESTTHFVTADAAGNLVACTQTLGGTFGSGVVHGATGLALNNFAHWFDLDPESPNVIAPGKKVEMCLAPSQIWRDGRPFMIIGTPGSFGIMQTTPQMMMNVIDHGFSIQAAIEAPRFRTMTGYELPLEGRFDPEVVRGLERRGHQPQLLDDWTMFVGGGQGIMIDPDSGAFLAGADPRRDGYALAY